MPPTLRKESPTHRTQVHWWFAGVAAGCERKREREARERAVAKARGSRDRDDSFVAAVHHRGAINSQRSSDPLAFPGTLPLPSVQNTFIPPFVPRAEASSFGHSQSSPFVGL